MIRRNFITWKRQQCWEMQQRGANWEGMKGIRVIGIEQRTLSAAAGCESCMEKIKEGKKKRAVSNKEYKKNVASSQGVTLNLTRSA